MIDVDLYVFKNVTTILMIAFFSILQRYVFFEIFTNLFFSLADFFVLIRWYLGYKSKINDGFGAGRDKKRDPLMGLFRI